MSESPRERLIQQLKDRIRAVDADISALRAKQSGLEQALNCALEILPTEGKK